MCSKEANCRVAWTESIQLPSGIYIMQNTMVRGGVDSQLGKENENQEWGKKIGKGKRKKEENNSKKGEKGLKNASLRL